MCVVVYFSCAIFETGQQQEQTERPGVKCVCMYVHAKTKLKIKQENVND